MTTEADIPQPPEEYMSLVCGPHPNLIDHFKSVGGLLVHHMRENGMIFSGMQFLDIGCGCGRVARLLVDEPVGRYEGFDRHAGMISWCEDNIATQADNFGFTYVPVISPYDKHDGQTGTIEAANFRFPYKDSSFDCVLLASVFTHMTYEQIESYLAEIRRVVKPAASVLFSVFHREDKELARGHNYFFLPRRIHSAVENAGFSFTYTNDPDKPVIEMTHHWYLLKPFGRTVPSPIKGSQPTGGS